MANSSHNTAQAEAGHHRDEVDVDKTLPCLVPPSEEEAKCYYRGICSEPRLVGRASAGLVPYKTIADQKEAWLRDPDRSNWFTVKEKTVTNIGSHRICTAWGSIEGSIKQAVRDLPWTSLDVVRLGQAEEPHASRPVTVWVGVEQHDIPWAMVARALRACKAVLDGNSLGDVDVQLRVSRVFSLAAGTVPADRDADMLLRPFDNAIGNAISPNARPAVVGTLGVYISPSGAHVSGRRPVWAITCRHVAVPSSLGQDNMWWRPSHRADDDANSLYPSIFMPPDETTVSSIDDLKDLCDLLESAVKLSGTDDNSARTIKASEAYSKAISLSDRDARAYGTIYLSPPISAAGQYPDTPAKQSPFVWSRDYCVLEIDSARFPAGKDTNTFEVGDIWEAAHGFQRDLRAAQKTSQPGFPLPDTGRIKVKGLIPLAELGSPRGPVENHKGKSCIIVMKKGAASGLTFGCPSEVLSTLRQCMPDGSMVETREWAIPGSFQNKRMAFSKAGDSGAAVVGLDGRLGGFLTRGAGADEGTSVDITYATPAVLVLEDIEKELGIPVQLL